MRTFLIISLIYLLNVSSSAQSLDQDRFIRALAGDGDIRHFISEEELLSSERLGISYFNEKDKFLIGYGFPGEIKAKILEGAGIYELSYPMTGDGYGALIFNMPSENYKQTFYFKNDRYISPLTFHTRNYTVKESDYFRFFIDDTTYFNEYSIEKLDNYVHWLFNLMDFTSAEVEILINEKFNYVLCKDNEEIKQVTGFDTRGMYVKAYDAVVTTFNTHYHEIAHGMMYFKQRTDIKPELLFFQEGFATTVGGRGGEDRKINLNLGYSLYNSKLISVSEIFSDADFINAGASIAYNVASLFNHQIMINENNFNKYLDIYNQYSGSLQEVNNFSISDFTVPEINVTEAKKYFETVLLNNDDIGSRDLISIESTSVSIAGLNYLFKTKGSFLLSQKNPLLNYKSKKYEEIFPDREYKGEKYYINVKDDDISVYNLYTNELIAMYAKGFSQTGEDVPLKDGYYNFSIPAYIFDEYVGDLIINN